MCISPIDIENMCMTSGEDPEYYKSPKCNSDIKKFSATETHTAHKYYKELLKDLFGWVD